MGRVGVLLVALGLLAGACAGDSKPSQADIDAAVAEALATTGTFDSRSGADIQRIC